MHRQLKWRLRHQSLEAIMSSKLKLVLVVLAIAVWVPSLAQADDLSGRWRGGWQSVQSGHRGRLSAKFRRIDSTHVRAKFTGTFAKIIPFRYRPVLDIVYEEPGLMILQGNKRLPLGGNFQYDATVYGRQFSATYRSRRDNGVWQMRR